MIGGGSWDTQEKPPTCCKSLTNFITYIVSSIFFTFGYSDIDECASSDHDCDQKCTNSEGTYWCSCFQGYSMTDRRCHGE